MYLYVNGRFVKDYLLNHAVMTAYRRLIEARRYPAVILGLEIAPGDVDVNVHPAKMEVRLRNPRGIYALIVETLSGAIGAGISPRAGVSAGPSSAGPAGYVSRIEEALKRYRVSSGPEKLVFGDLSSEKKEAPAIQPLPPPATVREPELQDERRRFSDLHYIGQTAGTYLIFSGEDGITLVDQHAAHERVLFEKLRRQAQGEKAIGQRLLLPEVVSLPPRDYQFLMESLPILEEAGI
jgi:DNA mismatch repair protein MutL